MKDTSTAITADSDPQKEYEAWKALAELNPQEWAGKEYTLEDFENYINDLKASPVS